MQNKAQNSRIKDTLAYGLAKMVSKDRYVHINVTNSKSNSLNWFFKEINIIKNPNTFLWQSPEPWRFAIPLGA